MIYESILEKLKIGEKSYFRGGNVLKNVLKKNKNVVSGEDALLLFNTYGIPLKILNIFLFSHGLEMDNEKFAELLLKQEEIKMSPRILRDLC